MFQTESLRVSDCWYSMVIGDMASTELLCCFVDESWQDQVTHCEAGGQHEGQVPQSPASDRTKAQVRLRAAYHLQMCALLTCVLGHGARVRNAAYAMGSQHLLLRMEAYRWTYIACTVAHLPKQLHDELGRAMGFWQYNSASLHFLPAPWCHWPAEGQTLSVDWGLDGSWKGNHYLSCMHLYSWNRALPDSLRSAYHLMVYISDAPQASLILLGALFAS